MGKKGYIGESLSFWIRMEERIVEPMGMLPKTWLVTAHFAKTCALKLVQRLRDTFKVFLLWNEDKTTLIS